MAQTGPRTSDIEEIGRRKSCKGPLVKLYANSTFVNPATLRLKDFVECSFTLPCRNYCETFYFTELVPLVQKHSWTTFQNTNMQMAQ